MANAVDAHVGARVRTLREQRKVSTATAADVLGLTPEQYAGREAGSERIGAAELFQLAKLLNTPMSAFFADLPKATG